MAASRSVQTYVRDVEQALERALCIQSFPSPKLEQCTAPQVELQDSPDLLLPPVTLSRGDKEACLIEGSINSVRVSLRLPASDPLEREMLSMYMRFLTQRADALQCLRKMPLPGWHISFLITDTHVVSLGKAAVIKLITNLILQNESEITALKMAVNARGRAVATTMLRAMAF